MRHCLGLLTLHGLRKHTVKFCMLLTILHTKS